MKSEKYQDHKTSLKNYVYNWIFLDKNVSIVIIFGV